MIKSEILNAASLIDRKELDRAIHLLESICDDSLNKENAGMKHLHLAIAYGKKKDLDKSNCHYRKTIDYEHPTGMAYEKLAINLAKQGKLEEAAEICQQLIDHPTIPQPRSYLTKDAMRKRKKKIQAKLAREQ